MKTYSYYMGHDDNVEQCPQLIAKWQERTIAGPNCAQKLNPNLNVNVHMIAVEPQDLNIAIITRGGAMTRAYQDKLQEQLQP